MAKKSENPLPVENESVKKESTHEISTLKKHLNLFGCSAEVFDGAIFDAVQNGLIKNGRATVGEVKKIIKNWLSKPMKSKK